MQMFDRVRSDRFNVVASFEFGGLTFEVSNTSGE